MKALLAAGRPLRSRRGSVRCPRYVAHARRGDQHGRRRAPDIVTVARRRWPCARILVVGRPGPGRRRGRGAGARAPAGQPAARRRSLHRRAGRRRRGGPGRVQQRGGLPRAGRGAGADHLRGGPRDRHLAHRPGGRLRAATPSAAAELALADRRDVLRLVDDLALATGGRARRPHPAGARAASERAAATGCRRRWTRRSSARRHRRRPARRPARRAEPARVLERGYAVPTRRRRPGAQAPRRFHAGDAVHAAGGRRRRRRPGGVRPD